MNKQLREAKDHPYFRVLSFLVEHKIAVADQIYLYCFAGKAKRTAWKVIHSLKNSGWITSNQIVGMPHGAKLSFSLDPEGLKALRQCTDLESEKIQIKSNQPYHDAGLVDLRIAFSKIPSCKIHVTENLIQMKLFENEVQALSLFRSLKSDAAVLMDIEGKRQWMALEFECNDKGIFRNTERFKKWYQTEDLRGVLFVTHNDTLKKRLMRIDEKIYPNLKRKILFSSLQAIESANSSVTFESTQQNKLVLTLSNSMVIKYPILDRDLSLSA